MSKKSRCAALCKTLPRWLDCTAAYGALLLKAQKLKNMFISHVRRCGGDSESAAPVAPLSGHIPMAGSGVANGGIDLLCGVCWRDRSQRQVSRQSRTSRRHNRGDGDNFSKQMFHEALPCRQRWRTNLRYWSWLLHARLGIELLPTERMR